MTFEVVLQVKKNLCLHDVDILEKFYKDYSLNVQIIYRRKDDFEISR